MKSLRRKPKCVRPKILSAMTAVTTQTHRKTNLLKAVSNDKSQDLASHYWEYSDLSAPKNDIVKFAYSQALRNLKWQKKREPVRFISGNMMSFMFEQCHPRGAERDFWFLGNICTTTVTKEIV